jgi:hypothetical protein
LRSLQPQPEASACCNVSWNILTISIRSHPDVVYPLRDNHIDAHLQFDHDLSERHNSNTRIKFLAIKPCAPMSNNC